MYMNFGPLSKSGGYRRLNVAITRAKFNVKLVGSIHPTDIRLENTNSEGVKLLRSYIEFAINGTSVLQKELNYSNIVEVDSPFE
jgi:superfamily I DNA and/or RNA helicase